MDNAWDDLPNAKHIDRVLAHAQAHLNKWQRAAYNVPVEVRANALNDFRDQLFDSERVDQCDAARGAATEWLPSDRLAVKEFVRTAVTALAADDDCAYMLDTPPTVVRLLAATGNNAAVLLLPAVIAMYEGD